jgi:hypothetical protein
MPRVTLIAKLFVLCTSLLLALSVSAQSSQPYPNAVTDRLIHPETPMSPPPRNIVFTDPDFGSSMVRATDPTTNFQTSRNFPSHRWQRRRK